LKYKKIQDIKIKLKGGKDDNYINLGNKSKKFSIFDFKKSENKIFSINDGLNKFFNEEILNDIYCSKCSLISTKKSFDSKNMNGKIIKIEKNNTNLLQNNVNNSQIVLNANLFDKFYLKGVNDEFLADINEFLAKKTKKNINKEHFDNTMIENISYDNFFMELESIIENVKCDFKKQFFISRLPAVLCINLCRRVFDHKNGKMVKLKSFVEFPVHLNLFDYFNIDLKHQQNKEFDKKTERNNCNNGRENYDDFEYVLKAVIVHNGNAEAGNLNMIIFNVKVLFIYDFIINR
jgi:hypothetical protein